MANRMYYSDDLEVHDNIKHVHVLNTYIDGENGSSYHKLFEKCQFVCYGDEKRELIDKMNQFIAANTHNRIQNMIQPKMINEETIAVLNKLSSRNTSFTKIQNRELTQVVMRSHAYPLIYLTNFSNNCLKYLSSNKIVS